MAPKELSDLMGLFERVGHIYKGHMMSPTWEYFGEPPNTRGSFELFLGYYAYEYQGASPAYAPAAAAVIRTTKLLEPSTIWREYQALVGGKMNANHQPLAHSANDCRCLLCVFSGTRGGPVNLIASLRELLLNGGIVLAHERLMLVRGIGPKIASLFLRDLAMRYAIEPEQARWLLQPVDVWIRRFAAALSDDALPSDSATAHWIIEHCVDPELANAGMWYFGARIASRKLTYERALADPRFAQREVERYVDRLAAGVDAWRSSLPARRARSSSRRV